MPPGMGYGKQSSRKMPVDSVMPSLVAIQRRKDLMSSDKSKAFKKPPIGAESTELSQSASNIRNRNEAEKSVPEAAVRRRTLSQVMGLKK